MPNIKKWVEDNKKRKKAIAKTNQKIDFKALPKNVFYYSLLRFTYSQVLGEVLNVGILFIYPSERKVFFKYPIDFKRISVLYKDFSIKGIENYCKEFESVEIDKNFDFNNVSNLIEKYYLPFDASSLRFDLPKPVLLQDVEFCEIVGKYFSEYFDCYE